MSPVSQVDSVVLPRERSRGTTLSRPLTRRGSQINRLLDTANGLDHDCGMKNDQTIQLFRQAIGSAAAQRMSSQSIARATVLDAGIDTPGSLAAGILLARLCLADDAQVRLVPVDPATLVSDNAIYVHTDQPLVACLGSQYAGWPVQTDDFFAMGSGPMRMVRGKEAGAERTGTYANRPRRRRRARVRQAADRVGDRIDCRSMWCRAEDVHLAIAPSTSIAGSRASRRAKH